MMKKRTLSVLAVIFLFLSIYLGTLRGQAYSALTITDIDRQKIVQVINNYFDVRYQSFKNLQLGDFTDLIIDGNDNQNELNKLDLTIYQHKTYNLTYKQYKYNLDFGEIIYQGSLFAKVNVIESNDIFYENSSPKSTKTSGIRHTINLEKQNENWKIFSDKYEDDFWKMLRNTNHTNEELRAKIKKTASEYSSIMSSFVPTQSVKTLSRNSCLINGVNVCFNRQGARDYAFNHASYETRNQDYEYIPDNDCTNFISQALFLGGGIRQYFPQASKGEIMSDGWYHTDSYYHSTSWDTVDPFYAFLLPKPTQKHYNYLGGPQARELNPYDPNDLNKLQIGDIIQFDWDCPSAPYCDGWDHSVIVDDIQAGVIYIDSHTSRLSGLNLRIETF